ncbi:ABC transporter ATP-binding protein [Enemella evansiae]|uniref:ABC transporter ATP-binding protein n=1 Tax=Enemella evansiae TaxID=2016499 RepID=A0A255GFS2_9ACTN|nr:ABC transporter ATP-binding protein [Enemella evansiae]OYO07517.1 ABC transporter ATP-binding protein [Enemella evansiae]OYO12522.1 ABC transporter ATP-binding protein [Enemella evansiae]OYO14421.1 ABC transporter ATP-binding protein [Enemella evansiae]TDO93443.1 ABC-type dipeptide/oligopeptide/nickel transport system ATPase component [Enemella evansiae]
MAPLVQVADLRVAFADSSGPAGREVLHGIDLTIERGARVGLIGESGSGKSLTALALMGLLPETARTQGSVRFDGRELLGRPDREVAPLRGDRMSMVFQEPMTALDPTMRIGRQVAEVWQLHRAGRGSSGRDQVLQILQEVGLDDPARIAKSFPHQLSGGQRQRVVLAMALINRPELVICDEPTTALDVTVQARVLRLLDRSLTEVQAACLFISHDLAVVAQVCDELVVMLDGSIVERGPTAELLRDPQHGYTRGLLATAQLDRVEPGARLPVVADFYAGEAIE